MDNPTPAKQFSAFLPVCLLAISSLLILFWNLKIVRDQHAASVQFVAQLDTQLAQALQAEVKLKQMMADLLDISKTDTDAATIVKRYGISFSPTPAATTAPTPAAATVPSLVTK